MKSNDTDFCNPAKRVSAYLGTIVTLLIFANVAFAHPAPITALQAKLNKITTMQANFEQTVYSEHNKLLHTYSGNMEFKKPNMFRWEVINPDRSLLITNGEKLWNYDVSLDQVTIQKYSANKEVTPISFILDDSKNLPNNFKVQQLAHNCYELIPKLENSNFVNVSVCFKNDSISYVKILDHMGHKSMFEFSQVKNNLTIAAQRFSFKPPAGVDVVGD